MMTSFNTFNQFNLFSLWEQAVGGPICIIRLDVLNASAVLVYQDNFIDNQLFIETRHMATSRNILLGRPRN